MVLARCGSPWVRTNRVGVDLRDQGGVAVEQGSEQGAPLDDEVPRLGRRTDPTPSAPPGRRAAPAGRRPSRRRGRRRRPRHGIRRHRADRRAGRARPCGARRPRTAPSRTRAPRPRGYTRQGVRLARAADDHLAARSRRGATTQSRPCSRSAVAVVSAARSRPNGAASRSSSVRRRSRRSSAVANHRHPSAVSTHQWWLPKPDRCVLDRDDVERPAAHQRRAHVGIREVGGPGEHPSEPPTPRTDRVSAGGAPGCAPARAGRCRTAPPRARASAPGRPAARASGRRCGAARRPRTPGSTRSR